MVMQFDLWVQRGDYAEKATDPLPVDGPCLMSLRHDGRVVLQHYIYVGQQGTLQERQVGNLWAWGIGPVNRDLVWLLPSGDTCSTTDLERIMDRLAWLEERETLQ